MVIYLQKDDIIIRKGIVHILDTNRGEMALSEQMLDLKPDLNEFIRGHIYKILSSDDAKKCRFEEATSPVFSMLEELEEGEDTSFIDVSKKLAEHLFDIMTQGMDIPAADLVVASFQVESTVHLALLKMNYKESYIHNQSEDSDNQIVKQRIILPSGGSRLSEAAVINLDNYEIWLFEKKYEINGEKVNYLSENFLVCHTQLPVKKKLNILTKVINDVNNKFNHVDVDTKLKSKSILQDEFVENNAFDVHDIGEKVFEGHHEMQQEFEDKMEKYDMQYDNFTVVNDSTVKKLEKQVMVTDTGIEITIPMEEYKTKSNIEVVTDIDGMTTITIKNIDNLVLK